MRIRVVASILFAGAVLIGLGGCHDGYSTVGYSYYGSYGSACDRGYTYYPSTSYSFRYSTGHHYHGGYHGGHWGGRHHGHHHGGYHGGHRGGGHCRY